VGVGPWDKDWPNKTVYPGIDEWPGNERYFSNLYAPLHSEFTIHENLAPAAAIFGFLCAEPGPAAPASLPEQSKRSPGYHRQHIRDSRHQNHSHKQLISRFMETTPAATVIDTPERLNSVSAGEPNRRMPLFSTAGFFSVEGSPRSVINFNPGWRFQKGDVEGAQAPEFDDSQWVAANLPHGLEILGEKWQRMPELSGTRMYRKKFDAEPGSGKVFLYFEAVMGKCAVWINGKLMAEHFWRLSPVRCGRRPGPQRGRPKQHGGRPLRTIRTIPHPSRETPILPGFHLFRGIYRDVYLIQTPAVHVTLTELSKEVAGGVFSSPRRM